MLQPMTNGVKQVEFEATNVRQVIEGLDQLYPGVKERLVEEGRIRPSLAVSVDGEVARMGMLEKVGPSSEVHFVPAIAGGMPLKYPKCNIERVSFDGASDGTFSNRCGAGRHSGSSD
jgi:molybdopterin synthase sulfur carrier subunit